MGILREVFRAGVGKALRTTERAHDPLFKVPAVDGSNKGLTPPARQDHNGYCKYKEPTASEGSAQWNQPEAN